jgi:hypothetical protein
MNHEHRRGAIAGRCFPTRVAAQGDDGMNNPPERNGEVLENYGRDQLGAVS